MTMDFKDYEKQIRDNQSEKANDSKVTLGDIDALVNGINKNYKIDVEIPKYDISSFTKKLKTYKQDLVSSDHKKSDNAVDEMHNMLDQLKKDAALENNKAKAKQVKKAERVVFKEEEKARKILAKEEARLKEIATKQEAELARQRALADAKIKKERELANAEIAKMHADAAAQAEYKMQQVEKMKAQIEAEKAKLAAELKAKEEQVAQQQAIQQPVQQPVYIQQPVQPIYIQQPFIQQPTQQQMQQQIATTTTHETLMAELRKVVAEQKQSAPIEVQTVEKQMAPVKEVATVTPEAKMEKEDIIQLTQELQKTKLESQEIINNLSSLNSINQRRVVRMQDIERRGINGWIFVALLALIAVGIAALIWVVYNRG